ncbi:hypothetical protein EV360DRAFT_81967 [Lentinula raphanica]|nr:hypothetical protein EV360DRAFT_81967 [Lentinula raphanica]
MLKRRRASSPPPSSSSSVPLIVDPTPMGHTQNTKRRRVQPPVLDGQMRGWGTSQDMLYDTPQNDDDDGEEDIIEEDESPHALVTSHSTDLNSPYKSANGFLYELHALQRHRHVFSANSPIQPPSFSNSAHDPSHRHHAWIDHDHPSEKRPSSPISIPSYNTSNQQDDHMSALDVTHGKRYELDLVRGRYEEGNRFLGSVVQLRRRELECRPDRDGV